MTRTSVPALSAACVLAALAPADLLAADGRAIFEAECAACHGDAPPSDPTLEERLTRKGPPLHYAGDKFRRDWLVAWLQDPVRIRPAGDFYGAHVKPGPEGDVIDEAGLAEHLSLPAAKAEAVSDYLMTLSTHADLIAAQNYQPQPISERMGMMDFGKFKGCSSCHSDEEGYGGVSGPELYTAWDRLRPDFIVSYIRDPQAWEPFSLMPNQHLNEAAAGKLANYLMVIAGGQP